MEENRTQLQEERTKPPEQVKRMPAPLRIALVLLCVLLFCSGAVVAAGKVLIDRLYYLSILEDPGDATHVPIDELTLDELPSESAEEIADRIESEIAYRPEDAPTVDAAPYQDPEQGERSGQTDPSKEADPNTLIYSDHVYNLLLIGVDRRNDTWNGNSDSMLLLSVNYDEGRCVMTSFMRDTAVSLAGYGIRKLNSAYAVGGGPLLVSTIQTNFGIYINHYAWIDFDGLEAIVDLIGGVDITVTPKEAARMKIKIEKNETLHLDGQQALVYARDRYSGGYDYGRTQRQRNTLNAAIRKIRDKTPAELMQIAETALPYVNHNLDENTLVSLLASMPSLLRCEFTQQRVPYDGLYSVQGEFLVPDFAATIQRLYETIY